MQPYLYSGSSRIHDEAFIEAVTLTGERSPPRPRHSVTFRHDRLQDHLTGSNINIH